MKNPPISVRVHRFRVSFALLAGCFILSFSAAGQTNPYARVYLKSKEDVDKALKELQAYAGQSLPTVDGFVAGSDRALDHYERPFCQFSIELLPGPLDATTVRVAAKITAWHSDPDPLMSSYQVLPSNGRLEMDLLDRLAEKFERELPASVLPAEVQIPKPTADYSVHLPRTTALVRGSPSLAAVPSAISSSAIASNDELATLRAEREAKEKRIEDLNVELRNLQEVQKNQAQPRNLAIVKNAGTPVLAQPAEKSRVLFAAAEGDEFEFLNISGEWVHVSISGASRGYIRRSSLTLPEFIAPDRAMTSQTASKEFRGVFRVEREEISMFPGDWEPLRGKPVKIYTVQPSSQDYKETNAQAKYDFALSLFRKVSAESARDAISVEGAVVIFDSADGGIIGSTIRSVRQMAAGSLSESDFRMTCFLDPPDAFQPTSKH